MLATFWGKIWDYWTDYFSHPYVDLEITQGGFGKYCNVIVRTSKEPVYTNDAVYNYDFFWNYKLTIKNNSTKPIFYIKIEEVPSYFTFLSELSKTESLHPFQELNLNCSIQHSDIMNGNKSNTILNAFPYFIDTITIVLSYQNERHKCYYTTFTFNRNGQHNEHKKKRIWTKKLF